MLRALLAKTTRRPRRRSNVLKSDRGLLWLQQLQFVAWTNILRKARVPVSGGFLRKGRYMRPVAVATEGEADLPPSYRGPLLFVGVSRLAWTDAVCTWFSVYVSGGLLRRRRHVCSSFRPPDIMLPEHGRHLPTGWLRLVAWRLGDVRRRSVHVPGRTLCRRR